MSTRGFVGFRWR